MTVVTNLKAGLAFGLTNLTTYIITTAMFFFGALLLEYSIEQGPDPETGKLYLNPENVFIALFAIMFGASHAGTAAAFGPDNGKA